MDRNCGTLVAEVVNKVSSEGVLINGKRQKNSFALRIGAFVGFPAPRQTLHLVEGEMQSSSPIQEKS